MVLQHELNPSATLCLMSGCDRAHSSLNTLKSNWPHHKVMQMLRISPEVSSWQIQKDFPTWEEEEEEEECLVRML